MKKIEAIIRPYLLEELKESLFDEGIKGLTISEVRGYGRQKGHKETYRGSEYQIDFVPKLKLEVIVDDQICERITTLIIEKSKTGKIGDGKIFISNVEDVIRIRTGESGIDAI
ncbi:MAG: P-II family nitrogen regulator [Ignavibacteriales bacterium]|nr:P-II family nitrogen regulator [Ignavibacteriota bacterium]MCB0747233.1 P-II family nitrogen regulator [Ignavibacteriota bacterium]MCB9247935.1 P-II family nitrogen regulator [Ignavibacteriales bacterium]